MATNKREQRLAAMNQAREQRDAKAEARRNAPYERAMKSHPEWMEMNPDTMPYELVKAQEDPTFDPKDSANHGAKGFTQMSYSSRRDKAVVNGLPTPKGIPTVDKDGDDAYRKIVFIGVLSEGDRKAIHDPNKNPEDIRIYPRFSFSQAQASADGLREQNHTPLSRGYMFPNGYKDAENRVQQPAKNKDGKNMVVEGNRMTPDQWKKIVEVAKQTPGAYMETEVDKPQYDENNRLIEGAENGTSRKAYVAIAATFNPARERKGSDGRTWMNPNSLRLDSIEPVTPEHFPEKADLVFDEEGNFKMETALAYDHHRGIAITHARNEAIANFEANKAKGKTKSRSAAPKEAAKEEDSLSFLKGMDAKDDASKDVDDFADTLGAPEADNDGLESSGLDFD